MQQYEVQSWWILNTISPSCMHIHTCTYAHPQPSETLKHKALRSIWVSQRPVCSKGPGKKNNCEKGWDSICHTERTQKGTWGEGSSHRCLRGSEHGSTDSIKSFSRRLRAFLKSDKGSELHLLITGQLKNMGFQKMARTKQLLHHPTCSACPMVSTHPSCPAVRYWPGEREVWAQNRATVPASPWASAGVSQVARLHVSFPVQGILERFSFSHLTAENNPAGRTGNRPAHRITCLEWRKACLESHLALLTNTAHFT